MKDTETAVPRGLVVPEEKQICGIAGFLKIFREIGEAKETRRDIIGEVEGPFFSRAVYGCMIRIGMGSNGSHTSDHRRSK